MKLDNIHIESWQCHRTHVACECVLKRLEAACEVVEAGRRSLGINCINGRHADEGCKDCALAIALKKYDEVVK